MARGQEYPKPQTQQKEQEERYSKANGNESELFQGQRTDYFVFGLYELWDLELHNFNNSKTGT